MLESLSIKGFKKFEELQINDFGNINFIVGDNNMGKTTVLQAIFVWATGFNVDALFPFILGAKEASLNFYAMAECLGALTHSCSSKDFRITLSGKYSGEEIFFEHHVKVSGVYLGLDNLDKKFELRTNGSSAANFPELKRTTIAQWDISDQKENKASYAITMPWTATTQTPPNKLAFYMDMLSHRDSTVMNGVYSQLKKNGTFGEFLARVKVIFPEVENVEIIPYPDGINGVLSVKLVNGKYLPLYSFGDGFRMWLYVMGATINAKDALICMDEVDATLHPSLQAEFCKNLMKNAAKSGAQIFFTTHNLEFIDRALEAYNSYCEQNAAYKLNVITLKEFDGEVKVRNLDGHLAYDMRRNFSMELR